MLTVYKLDEILNVAAAILFLMVSGHISMYLHIQSLINIPFLVEESLKHFLPG